MSNQVKTTGFTLLEVLVYVGVLAIILTFTLGNTLDLYKRVADVHVSRDLNAAAIVALERTNHEIRNAVSINNEALGSEYQGTTSVALALYQSTESGTEEVYIYASNGQLLFQIETGTPLALSSDDLEISDLSFTKMSSDVSEAVRVSLTMSIDRDGVSLSREYADTIVLRGSY